MEWIRIQYTDMKMSRMLEMMRYASDHGFEVHIDGDACAVMIERRKSE